MIEIMSETKGSILAIKATEKLSTRDYEEIAVVGDPKWVEWSTKIGSHFIGGQAKTYDAPDIQAAISWVKE
jgi:hypothetical protein